MPMKQVIQSRRKTLGLTQEQLAEQLGVSTPAVSKWETGASCPDLPLLPPLARLLKIDLNTLFCFRQELSPEETGQFCRELVQLAHSGGLAAAFAAAEETLLEYPHCDLLLQSITLTLDGLLNTHCPDVPEREQWDRKLDTWYEVLSQSEDSGIRNCADYMLAGRALRKHDLVRVQAILDRMPDRETLLQNMADQQLLQTEVYLQQQKADQAAEVLERMLLQTVNKVQMLLFKLARAELQAEQAEAAELIAEKARTAAELFDLQPYSAWVAPFEMASAQKQTVRCLHILEHMLRDIHAPWNVDASPLYHRLAGTARPVNTEQLYEALRRDLETNPAYEFLQKDAGFRDLFRT